MFLINPEHPFMPENISEKRPKNMLPKTSRRRGGGRFYRPKIYISVREVLPQVIKHVARDPSRRGHDKTPLIYFIRGSETYSKRHLRFHPSDLLHPGAVFEKYPSGMTLTPPSVRLTYVPHPCLCPTNNMSAVLLTTVGPEFSGSSPGAVGSTALRNLAK